MKGRVGFFWRFLKSYINVCNNIITEATNAVLIYESIESAFPQITDKEQATKDLLALTKDEDSSMRAYAAIALGPAFSQLTDKELAWKKLLKSYINVCNNIFTEAANAVLIYESVESAFPQITDKEQATKDLFMGVRLSHPCIHQPLSIYVGIISLTYKDIK